MFPFYYMVLLSMREISEVIESPGSIFVGLGELSTAAYERVLKPTSDGGEGFLRFLLNSLGLALGTVVVTLAVSILGAYAVSRLEFFGRRAVHFLFLSVYLFPPILLAIPLFVAFSKMGLRGELLAAGDRLRGADAADLRLHAAQLLRDGADLAGGGGRGRRRDAAADHPQGHAAARVPAIAATGLFVFMIAWNEFLFALLFLVEERPNWTVSLGVSQLTNIETPATTLMAGSVILTVPIIVLFLFAERLMTEGLTRGAEKG